MTQTYSAASIYGNIDRMEAPAIHDWLNWHKRLKYPPRFINLFAAARFNEAPNLLRIVRDSLPNTTPVWRGFDGKDAWGNIPDAKMPWDDSNYYMRLWNHNKTSPAMAAGMWFARRVRPFVDVIRETQSIVMLLNEAAVLFNAPFETECIRLLGEEGLRAGAFAWATGTPDWPDYATPLIEDNVTMAAKYDALVMPHEYGGIKPEQQNSLIGRFSKLVSIYDRLKLPTPDVFLGEFGLAKAEIINSQIHLDANTGWRGMGVMDGQYMDAFISPIAKTYYVPNKVSFSLFDWAGWGDKTSFGVGSTAMLLDQLAAASEWMSFSVEDKPMHAPAEPIVISRPPEAQSSVRVRLKSIPADYRNLRAEPNYLAPISGDVTVGDVGRRFDIPARDGLVAPSSSGKWVFFEKLDGNTVMAAGWIWRDRATWEAVSSSTQEVPVVTQPPPQAEDNPLPNPPPQAVEGTNALPAPVLQKLQYSWEIETTPEMHEIIQGTIMTMLNNMALFGQALARSKVTLNTAAVA